MVNNADSATGSSVSFACSAMVKQLPDTANDWCIDFEDSSLCGLRTVRMHPPPLLRSPRKCSVIASSEDFELTAEPQSFLPSKWLIKSSKDLEEIYCMRFGFLTGGCTISQSQFELLHVKRRSLSFTGVSPTEVQCDFRPAPLFARRGHLQFEMDISCEVLILFTWYSIYIGGAFD